MAIKYRYPTQSGFIETLSLGDIPEGLSYETIEFDDSPVIEVPQEVTPRQMRVALIVSGTSIASIETMIAALPEPDQSIVRTTWEYSTAFERENPILNSMAGGLGLTQTDVDNLFILADTL